MSTELVTVQSFQ